MQKRKHNRSQTKLHIPSARFRWIAVLALAAAATGDVVVAISHHAPSHISSGDTTHITKPWVLNTLSESENGYSGRIVYPYSVIPGGIQSVGQLRKAMAADPFVAAQFAGFDLTKTRMIPSDRERYVYVSYRRGSQLFWTTRKIALAKGEMVVTDGVLTARSRCGNLVSDVPASPPSTEEPTVETLDTPATLVSYQVPESIDPGENTPPNEEWGNPPEQVPPGTNAQPISNGNDPGFIPPPYLFLPPGGPLPPTPPTPLVVAVPEPSTLFLLLASLPVLLALRKRIARPRL